MIDLTLKDIEELKEQDAPLRDKVQAIFHGTIAIRDFVRDSIVPLLRTTLDRNDHEQAILGIYYRMYFWLDSVVLLNSARHFQAASSAARTMFELLLDVKQLVEDPANAERFHAFTFVERFRAAKKQVDFADKHGSDPNELKIERSFVADPTNVAKYETDRQTYWGKDKNGETITPKHWSKRDVAGQAAYLGRDYECQYIAVYARLSWYTHGGASGIDNVSRDGLEAAFGSAHALIQEFMCDATEEVAKAFYLFTASADVRTKLEAAKRIPGESLIRAMLAAKAKTAPAT